MIRIEGEDDPDDPIVWEVGAERVTDRLEFRRFVMTESCRQRLTEAFGAEWLERHKAEKEAELRAWQAGSDVRVQ